MKSQNDETEKLRTPFAEHSWEPRFAIDAWLNQGEAIELGLRCCLTAYPFYCCNFPSDPRYFGFLIFPTRFAVAPVGTREPSLYQVPSCFENFSLEEAVNFIVNWLSNDAEYPEMPWFDGGERKGFQMYHVPYMGKDEELNLFRGFTLIEPKWFEVHK